MKKKNDEFTNVWKCYLFSNTWNSVLKKCEFKLNIFFFQCPRPTHKLLSWFNLHFLLHSVLDLDNLNKSPISSLSLRLLVTSGNNFFYSSSSQCIIVAASRDGTHSLSGRPRISDLRKRRCPSVRPSIHLSIYPGNLYLYTMSVLWPIFEPRWPSFIVRINKWTRMNVGHERNEKDCENLLFSMVFTLHIDQQTSWPTVRPTDITDARGRTHDERV